MTNTTAAATSTDWYERDGQLYSLISIPTDADADVLRLYRGDYDTAADTARPGADADVVGTLLRTGSGIESYRHDEPGDAPFSRPRSVDLGVKALLDGYRTPAARVTRDDTGLVVADDVCTGCGCGDVSRYGTTLVCRGCGTYHTA